jgi:hypothetical protein
MSIRPKLKKEDNEKNTGVRCGKLLLYHLLKSIIKTRIVEAASVALAPCLFKLQDMEESANDEHRTRHF